MKEISSGIFRIGKHFATESLVPKFKVYEEKVLKKGKKEFRIINPYKSKLGAALQKGLRVIPLKEDIKILYLGLASGTTASHLSDIVGKYGLIYGIEFASRSLRDSVFVSKKRNNIIPIFEDARLPENYAQRISKVDMIYCDVAQKDQSSILIRNSDLFLKKDGYVMIAIKARSIDVTKKPSEVFKQEREKLEKRFNILQEIRLDPYEKDHMLIVGKFK
jgi:fibrillarin-like pre-rRNA processing protein